MSQFPPPPGQPQMSPQMSPHMSPQYAPPGMGAPQYRTSAAAITALIAGILGCIPLITSLVAVICGIVGIRATSNPQVRGRGMAITGLILGIIGLVLWPLCGAAVIGIFVGARPHVQMADQFTRDLSTNNVAAAQAVTDTSSITPADLQALADQMKSWGAFKKLTVPGRSVVTANGKTTWTLIGAAEFTSATKTAEFEITKQSDGSYKVNHAKFE